MDLIRNRSKSKSPSHSPLILASELGSNREKDISYVQGDTFVQSSFKSQRKTVNMIHPEEQSSGGLSKITSSSAEYTKAMQDKAHESAIFAPLNNTQDMMLLLLGTRGEQEAASVYSSVDQIKQIVNPKVQSLFTMK
ncbi:hypothetical protein Ciccas_005143 [Cichlidogyrus casuarinus]|uniref:Uncharacterized protein n=1 Tax=Cichlidogyrus casuarinus TaxID=1844966 RepID=A0ABD2Q9G5_9PLAT